MGKIKYLFLSLIIFIIPVLSLAGCGGEQLGASYKAGTPTSYITLNINPNVELVADHKNKVIAINAVNDEASLLFFNKDYRGYDVDVVIREMVKVMAQTGYLVADSEINADAVFVSVYSTSTEVKNLVQAKIKSTTEAYFAVNGLYATVLETTFDNKITTEAQKNSITDHARFRAILKAMEYDADAELKTVKDMNSTKLIEKLYKELSTISQIKTKAQKDAYLNTRTTLKQAYKDGLVTLFNHSQYTQLYNELEALIEQYRTETDINYANNTIKPLIESKSEEIKSIETQLYSQFSSQIATRKALYSTDIENVFVLNAQLSQDNVPNYYELLQNKKTEFLSGFETRQNYAKYNAYLWQTEYETWKPNTTEKLNQFLSAISTKVNAVKTSTRIDVTRALNRINPYTRSQFFGDSSGSTWTFP